MKAEPHFPGNPKRKRGRTCLRSRFVSSFMVLMLLATPSFGDNHGRYQWDGFDSNLESILQKYLEKSRTQPFEELLKNFSKDFKIDPNGIDLDLSKENFKWVEELLKEMEKSGKVPQQRLDKLNDELKGVKKFIAEMQSKTAPPMNIPPKLGKINPDIKSIKPPPLPTTPQVDEDFARWAKEQLDWAGESPYGEFVRELPAFKGAIEDIQQQIAAASQQNDWQVPNWLPENQLPDWGMKLPEKLWNGLPEWTPPELPRMNVNLPRFPAIRGRLPSFSAPRVSAPNLAAAGETVLWIIVFAGCGFVLWQLIRRAGNMEKGAAFRLGPWPLDPRNIRSAADLIAAFEYLSLLRFGEPARSWNHAAVAVNLASGDTAHQQAANELAQLYAQARYAPPQELLTPQALDAARKHLCSLAGAS